MSLNFNWNWNYIILRGKKNICWVICLLAVVKSVNPLSDLILNVFINGYLSSNPEIQKSKLEFQL